jgi:hypothetical protein
MSTDPGQPSEEELRAAYEAQIKQIGIEQVLLEDIVTMVNLGMRKTGIPPGTEDERDPAQVQLAIEAIRALLPIVERAAPQQVGPIRDALSQLQMAYVRIGGGASGAGGASADRPHAESGAPGAAGQPGAPGEPAPRDSAPERPKPGEPGPAQRSGKLWVPGQ